jgi:hypothetical protein
MKIDFSKAITAPVLFMVFNRPEKTRQVFEMIRAVRPEKLYVAVDHPREGRQDDEVNCAKVKAIVENVDWPCEAHYLYHPENRGCTLAGKMAWDWLFEHEDRMIFLEDDGLPTKSFFYFIQAMLDRYRDDARIAYVGGVNYGLKYGAASYFFSHLPAATYAMGTWKRVYDLYEYKMESFPVEASSPLFRKKFPDLTSYWMYMPQFWRYVKQGGNTYDIQMIYLSYKYGMYSIAPNTNMVSNIGLDGGANNCADVNSEQYKRLANRPRFEIDEICDPDKIFVDEKFERKWFDLRVLQGGSRMKFLAKTIVKKCLGRTL